MRQYARQSATDYQPFWRIGALAVACGLCERNSCSYNGGMKRRRAHLAFLMLFLLTGDVVFAQSDLAARIESIMNRPEFTHSLFGIKIYSLDTGKTLYAQNAGKFFKPASTTKLLTMGTALGVLGQNYRFHTNVYATGPVVKNNIRGDLILVASGDPNLSGRIQSDGTLAFTNVDHAYDGSPDTEATPGDPLQVIKNLASQVAGKGIKKIKGRILIDSSLYPSPGKELGTDVVISPIVVNDNVIDVVVTAGKAEGDPGTISVSPPTSYARFVNQVKTGSPESRPSINMDLDVTDKDGNHLVTVSGAIPAGKHILYVYRVPEPSRFASTVFEEALLAKGIKIEGKLPNPETTRNPAESYKPENLMAEHISPPLAEEVKVTLKVSQNLHASAWPGILGAVVKKDGKDSFQSGFDVEREFLANAGLDLTGAAQGDGAGGAEAGVYTPDFMVSYLEYMYKRPDFPVFFKALPILGQDGTLHNIQTQSPAAGHVFAKTGTYGDLDQLNRRVMLTAKGLAGYITTSSGEHLAFAAYVNRVSLSLDPDEIARVAGQALGEIAAAAYQ